ncbi:hypothetical protein BBP40_005190 [Aspergillus hancockii]|nr:hypothetical protein BBP40_005190 [Aspergillus hancockii]
MALYHQGRIPLYSAAVESAQQILLVVQFIHIYRLQEFRFRADFRLGMAFASLGPGVTIGAGVMMGHHYAMAAQEGYIPAGGDYPTVGAALRGGGGGTFGVVTRATVRVFPDVSAVIAEPRIEEDSAKSQTWSQSLSIILTTLQSLNRENVGGQLVISALPEGRVQASLKVNLSGQLKRQQVPMSG